MSSKILGFFNQRIPSDKLNDIVLEITVLLFLNSQISLIQLLCIWRIEDDVAGFTIGIVFVGQIGNLFL